MTKDPEIYRAVRPAVELDNAGNHRILLLEMFRDKGYDWSYRLVYPLKTAAFKYRNGAPPYFEYYWGDPKLEVKKYPSEKRDGSICYCTECVEGRKYVDETWWTP